MKEKLKVIGYLIEVQFNISIKKKAISQRLRVFIERKILHKMRDTEQQVDELIANSNHISKWVEQQPSEDHLSYAQSIFTKLFASAAQPKSSSGNACVKLCGFVEQASKSSSPKLRSWAFSQEVVLRMFNFYIEWNESDNHRSMKLVLDLVPKLLRKNPDHEIARSAKRVVLDSLVSIIVGKSSKPLAKSAIKALDHFLTKSIFTLEEIRVTYVSLLREKCPSDNLQVWRSFVAELFHWMRLHFVCPTAGRFIMTLYRYLQRDSSEKAVDFSIEVWHQWLLEALSNEPSLLESIKTYIFLPLFKVDRGEALQFLKRMNEHEAISASASIDLNLPALLQLAALETGKRVGLVEEPALNEHGDSDGDGSSITLHEKLLENVLAHPSNEVRSLAFSLLLSSPATTKPYSSTALDLLRKHLGAYSAESDAKFRNDVSSKVRDMFKRVRGAIFVLKKSIPRAAAKANGNKNGSQGDDALAKPILYRTNLISLPEAQLVECLEYHESFLSWYFQFLSGELTPTASYQRHIASLKAIAFILRLEGDHSKTWETSDDQRLVFDQFDGTWVRALSDLLMDPFDDVRDHAAIVLQRLFSDVRYRKAILIAQGDQVDASAELVEIVRRADELARRTARADHSDGVARTCQLLYRFAGGEQQRLSLLSSAIAELERKISVAEEDLGRAVLEVPLHGDFSSLSYTWQVVSELKFSESELMAVRSLQDRLATCCERGWTAVRAILCDDSPEGHLPQDLEEVDGLDTKDVLSFSFRATHEASNLMRTIVQSARQKNHEGRILPSREVYERIGNLTFNQLASLRHRGAFTTVAATFATCCQLAQHLEKTGVENQAGLLEVWYKGSLDAIFAQVSTTRRSAGIPAMMTGILSADASNPSFEQVMLKLMEIASVEARTSETDGSNLPQVHAFNCMKDIFKSSYLTAAGNKAEKYLPDCLELAANGLKSELWAIRNCALILLRSLLDCLFGSHESKATMESGWDGKANRISFHKYPTLPKVLLTLLKAGHQMMAPNALGSAAAESVFPALDIVRRAGPPDMLRGELEEHIAKYLASPVWHVREIAARTLCSCLLHDKWLDALLQIARASVETEVGNAQNCVHGVLLTMKYTIERLNEVMPDRLQGDIPKLEQFLKEYWGQIKSLPSPEVAAAYMEVINMVRALPNSEARTITSFEVPSGKQEGALLKAQLVIYKVHEAFNSSSPLDDLRTLLFNDRVGVNSLIPALETIPKLWDVTKISESQLLGFYGIYTEVCFKIGPAEPRVLALQNLTEILDQLLKADQWKELSTSSLAQLWNHLPTSLLNPALANAITRISGCLVAILRQSQDISPLGIQHWGSMVADAGLDDKDFDTRFAAAESLGSFFTATGSTCTTEEYLPALLAVYDCLNDDDDEVRDIVSVAVKAILGQALVPIEAGSRLLQWLGQTFKDSTVFRTMVAARLTGDANFKSAKIKEQLDQAMKFDDSLFAVEEQNLFIDEVREAQRWAVVLETLEWSTEDEVLISLTEWMHEGLRQMHSLASAEDGPLGYASQPQVFAILSRIIQGSAALIRSHPDPEQRKKIVESSRLLRSHSNHMSGLLLQPLQDTSSI